MFVTSLGPLCCALSCIKSIAMLVLLEAALWGHFNCLAMAGVVKFAIIHCPGGTCCKYTRMIPAGTLTIKLVYVCVGRFNLPYDLGSCISYDCAIRLA